MCLVKWRLVRFLDEQCERLSKLIRLAAGWLSRAAQRLAVGISRRTEASTGWRPLRDASMFGFVSTIIGFYLHEIA